MAEEYIAFNKALKNFIKCSMESFPDVIELKLLFATYKMMKTINKKKPYRFFHSMTEHCQDAILAKDEDYFTNNGIDCYDQTVLNVINVAKGRWDKLDQDSKNAVWAHLQVLVLLSRKCQKIDKP